MQSGGPFHTNQCIQCPEKFSSYSEHCKHVETVHFGKWKYKCGLCENLFDQKDEIKSHRAKIHTVKPLKKEEGDTSITQAKKKIAPKICDICGKTVYGLTTHR